MKILALILARSGSKRVPGKNSRILGDRPLISWSIQSALKAPDVCETLVSTDDAGIAQIAQEAGALVPWLRPAELCTDTATSADASLHALDWYEKEVGKVDGIMLLQPTSPFRSSQTIINGLGVYRELERPVLAMAPAASHPYWCFEKVNNSIKPFIPNAKLRSRSQDLPKAYVISGALYIISPGDLRKYKSFYCPNFTPLFVEDPSESIDIDSESDWDMAEFILKNRTNQM